MARRVSAALGIAVIVGLAVLLMWRVYLHHERVRDVEEEPAIVELMGVKSWHAHCSTSMAGDANNQCDALPRSSQQHA